MSKDKSFKEFVNHWTDRGYEVHVSKSVLEDLDRLEKGWDFTIWDLLAEPFSILEDLLDGLPQNGPIRWLSSWMATLAIIVNRPRYKRLSRKHRSRKTYRIG